MFKLGAVVVSSSAALSPHGMRAACNPLFGVSLAVLLTGCASTVPQATAPAWYATAFQASACMPSIEGPILHNESTKGYSRIVGTPPSHVEEEFFISCNVRGSNYRTLIHVIRPKNPANASGLVEVEPWHSGDNWTIFNDLKNYLLKRNDTSVIVVTQSRLLERRIKPSDPSRYSSLVIPDVEEGVPEMLAQVGALLKAGKVPNVTVKHLILAGHSETGAETRHYIDVEARAAKFNGHRIYDGYFPSQSALNRTDTDHPLPDVGVPVIEVQGERELIEVFHRGRSIYWRRPDGPQYRLYEVPGMAHISTRPETDQSGAPAVVDPSAAAYSDPKTWNCLEKDLSPLPYIQIKTAAFDSLVKWVEQGTPAPGAPRIATDKSGQILRDEFGNAKGGVPVVYFKVPTGTLHSVNGSYVSTLTERCDWIGSFKPFSEEALRKLYPTHAAYVREFDSALDAIVHEGFYPAEDAPELKAEAQQADIP